MTKIGLRQIEFFRITRSETDTAQPFRVWHGKMIAVFCRSLDEALNCIPERDREAVRMQTLNLVEG